MSFSATLCTSRDPRSMHFLIPSKLFFHPLSPHSKHTDFHFRCTFFQRKLLHTLWENKVCHLGFSLTYCKTRKCRAIPFNSFPSKASHSCTMSNIPLFFPLRLHCDHHLHLNQINSSISHTRDAGKLYLVHKTIPLTASWEWW